MVRDPGPTWSLTLVLIMLLSTHDLSYFLGTLGNQQQAEKFSWLLLDGIWYNLEQGRMGYTGKGLPEAMLMVICSHKVQMKSIPHLSQLAGTPFCRKHRGSLQVFVLGLHLWKACSFLLNSVESKPWENTMSLRFRLSQILISLVIEGQRGKGPNTHCRNAQSLCAVD